MKKLLGLVSFFTLLNAGFENPETGWEYQQSTFQGFYMLESAEVDGVGTLRFLDAIKATGIET